MAIKIRAMRFGGISPLAVIAGALSDIIGSNIFVGCYVLVVSLPSLQIMAEQGYSAQAMQDFMVEQMGGTAFVWVIGVLMTLVGGYIGGKIAKTHQVRNGFAVGIAVSLISLLMNVLASQLTTINQLTNLALWQTIIIYAAHILAAGIGGYLASLRGKLADN